MGIDELRDVIDKLVDLDPGVLADEETVLELHRQKARIDAVVTRATARFDASGDWRVSRSRSASHFLAWKLHQPLSTCRRVVSNGRALRTLPVAERAWLEGDICAEHVATLGRASKGVEKEMARGEKSLVELAKEVKYKTFVREVELWLQDVRPDKADEADEDKRQRRSCHLSESFEGMWFGNQVFDPISGAIVSAELKRLEKKLFDKDWAEAKERLGHEPTILDLTRTPAQRRADAMVEMAIRSRTAPANGRRPEPLLTVVIDYPTLSGRICQLGNGSPISPGALLPYLDLAWLERVVFGAESRVIDVGVAQRLFTGATRRALEVRDLECHHDSCEVPAEDCEGDHVVPWAEGGSTVQDNGQMACGFHNRERWRRRHEP
jgi:hypothetical protein